MGESEKEKGEKNRESVWLGGEAQSSGDFDHNISILRSSVLEDVCHQGYQGRILQPTHSFTLTIFFDLS